MPQVFTVHPFSTMAFPPLILHFVFLCVLNISCDYSEAIETVN